MTYPEQNGHTRADTDSASATMESREDVEPAMAEASVSSSSLQEKNSLAAVGSVSDGQRSCRTGYCRNMTFFVGCMSLVFLVRAGLLQYTEDVLMHIGHRYPITANELAFIVGCERIGFVATLLFVAYFGNRMHKPIAISVGVGICATGAMIMAVPFFVSGPRLYASRFSQFAIAGLCKQTSKNVSFQTQCDLIPYKDDDDTLPFSLTCVGMLLVGTGGAFFASLGLVYIEEGSKPRWTALYIGIVVSMHGFGRFIGNLLAAWFTSLPEAINFADSRALLQDYAVYEQERVGRWWLGYPIMASLLVCLALATLWFPRYIVIPDWVLRRQARLQAAIERYERQRAQARKRLAMEGGASHKKGRRRRRHKSGKGKGSSRSSRQSADIEESHDSLSQGATNELDVTLDEAVSGETVMPNGKDSQEHYDGDTVDGESRSNSRDEGGLKNEAFTDIEDNVINQIHSDLAEKEIGDNNSLEVNMEPTNLEERVDDFKDQKVVRREKKGRTSGQVNGNRKNERTRNSSGGDKLGKTRRHRHSGDQANGRKKRSSGSSQSNSKRHRHISALRKPRRIRFRKESLRDLPQSLWKLLHNIRVLILMLGAIFAGFFFNGYLATLPEYIHVQFQRHWQTSIILAGVAGPLSWGIGTLIGCFLMYKFRSVQLTKVVLAVVCCLFASTLLTTLAMAFHCQHDTSPNSTVIAICGTECECQSIRVQYEPLCGSDGKTYPSPCHAGCAAIKATDLHGVFNFTGCSCIEGGSATQGECRPRCDYLAGFVFVVFLSVCVASLGITPVLIFLFRSVKSRSKSLTIGFAIWGVYAFSQTLGPVAFRYVRSGRCQQWGQDCLQEDVCWRYDLQPYRLIVNGLAAVFLLAAAVSFSVAYFHLYKSMKRKTNQEQPPAGQQEKIDMSDNTTNSTHSNDVSVHILPDAVNAENQPSVNGRNKSVTAL